MLSSSALDALSLRFLCLLLIALALCALHTPSLATASKSTAPSGGRFFSFFCFPKQSAPIEDPAKQKAQRIVKKTLKVPIKHIKLYNCHYINTGTADALCTLYITFQDCLPLAKTKDSPLSEEALEDHASPRPEKALEDQDLPLLKTKDFLKRDKALKKLKKRLGYSFENGKVSIILPGYKLPYNHYPIPKSITQNPKIRLRRSMEPAETLYDILNAANWILAEFFLFETTDMHVEKIKDPVDYVKLKSYFSDILRIAYQSKSAYNPFDIKWHKLFNKRIDAWTSQYSIDKKYVAIGQSTEAEIVQAGKWIKNEYSLRGFGTTSAIPSALSDEEVELAREEQITDSPEIFDT